MAEFFDQAVSRPLLSFVPAWIHPNDLTRSRPGDASRRGSGCHGGQGVHHRRAFVHRMGSRSVDYRRDDHRTGRDPRSHPADQEMARQTLGCQSFRRGQGLVADIRTLFRSHAKRRSGMAVIADVHPRHHVRDTLSRRTCSRSLLASRRVVLFVYLIRSMGEGGTSPPLPHRH